jgi:hypothetical protein
VQSLGLLVIREIQRMLYVNAALMEIVWRSNIRQEPNVLKFVRLALMYLLYVKLALKLVTVVLTMVSVKIVRR